MAEAAAVERAPTGARVRCRFKNGDKFVGTVQKSSKKIDGVGHMRVWFDDGDREWVVLKRNSFVILKANDADVSKARCKSILYMQHS